MNVGKEQIQKYVCEDEHLFLKRLVKCTIHCLCVAGSFEKLKHGNHIRYEFII